MVKTVKRPTAQALFDEAGRYIPGSVNSPVRSFKAVGGYPVFVERASGSKIYSAGGESLIDYCLSWGSLLLGHAHQDVISTLEKALERGTSFGTATTLETELARLLVEAVPSLEQVRLTSSGTEAVMSALRLARAYTKREKIIKFEGSYHGHADYLLVKAGSGAAALGIPDSLGVPEDFTRHTAVFPYNDSATIEEAMQRHGDDVAAIIIEPIAANCGVIAPQPGFLQNLRSIADKHGIVLIFDEVITGFRVSYGGAQSLFGVVPDMTCLGKIIGGGLPVGAFGGKRAIMKLLAPEGGVYQAGTLSGNPIAVTAGITTLRLLRELNPYRDLEEKTEQLVREIMRAARRSSLPVTVNRVASLFSCFFTDRSVTDYNSAQLQDGALFKKFFHGILKRGVYFSPSGYEANFLSSAHTENDIEKTLLAIQGTFSTLMEGHNVDSNLRKR